MQKTAKEMFNDLGYECHRYDEECIVYKKYFEDVETTLSIIFDSVSKKCNCNFKVKEGLEKDVSLYELRAIYQQMKELGWDK